MSHSAWLLTSQSFTPISDLGSFQSLHCATFLESFGVIIAPCQHFIENESFAVQLMLLLQV
jgi:hypothetical protein